MISGHSADNQQVRTEIDKLLGKDRAKVLFTGSEARRGQIIGRVIYIAQHLSGPSKSYTGTHEVFHFLDNLGMITGNTGTTGDLIWMQGATSPKAIQIRLNGTSGAAMQAYT